MELPVYQIDAKNMFYNINIPQKHLVSNKKSCTFAPALREKLCFYLIV